METRKFISEEKIISLIDEMIGELKSHSVYSESFLQELQDFSKNNSLKTIDAFIFLHFKIMALLDLKQRITELEK